MQKMAEACHQNTEEMSLLQEMAKGPMHQEEMAATTRMLDGLKQQMAVEGEDVEAFLTIFEWMMEVRRMLEDQWAFKLVPILSGMAKEAYAVMRAADTARCSELREAILHRHDINSETYRQRF